MSPKDKAAGDGEHAPLEQATPRPSPALEYSAFPHIVEHIVACAPYDLLLTFRLTSRALKSAADAQFPRHIALMPDGCVQARVNVPGGRGPWVGVSPTCVFPRFVTRLDLPSITAECAYHATPSDPPPHVCDCTQDRNSESEQTHPHSGIDPFLLPHLTHLDIVRARADACSLSQFSAPTSVITYDFWDQYDRTTRGNNVVPDTHGSDSFSAFLDDVFDIDNDLDYLDGITRALAPSTYMPPRLLTEPTKLIINIVYRPGMGWPMQVVRDNLAFLDAYPDRLPCSLKTIVFMLIKDNRDEEAYQSVHVDNASSGNMTSVFVGLSAIAWQALSPSLGTPKEVIFVGFSEWDPNWTPDHFRALADSMAPERMLATILVNVLIDVSAVEEQVARDLVERNTVWASIPEYCTHVGAETFWLEQGF